MPKGSYEHLWLVFTALVLALTAVIITVLFVFKTIQYARSYQRTFLAMVTIGIVIVHSSYISIPRSILVHTHVAQRISTLIFRTWLQLTHDAYSHLCFINTSNNIIISYRKVSPSVFSYSALLKAWMLFNWNPASNVPMLVSRARSSNVLVTETVRWFCPGYLKPPN